MKGGKRGEGKGRKGEGGKGRGRERKRRGRERGGEGREGMPPNGNSWIRASPTHRKADATCSVGPYALTCNANIYPHFAPRDFAHPIATPLP